MRPLVVGIGEAAAGDDAVGLAVIDELRARGVGDGIELRRGVEPTALVELVMTARPVVVVDAAVGGVPGDVVVIDACADAGAAAEAFAAARVRLSGGLSTHGVGVIEALRLARAIAPNRVSPFVRIVAVFVAPPERFRTGLSTVVAAAVTQAASCVLEVLSECAPN